MTYADWIAEFDTLTPERRKAWQNSIAQLPQRPLISVLIPVYNPDLQFLEEAITSVEKQIYDHWEICLADDASTDPRVLPFLELRARHERRIKLSFRETNGHISACSNSALTLARGEWCALLDQDDALAEDALAEVAAEIGRHPEAGIVYSDEDFIDSLGTRSNPFFKPDWNPELFMGQNYLNHLGVYRTALLREIGGFREGFEGSQDYDLVLRSVARLRPDQIRHIPRLLYRWRMVQGSLADQPDAKPYARHAARDALNSYLQEQDFAARAESCPQNAESHRVIYETPNPLPTITVITSSQNTAWLRDGVDGLKPEVVPTNPDARSANEAAERAQGDVLLFLGGEIPSAEEGWLSEMLSHVVRPEVGIAGAPLWSPAGTLEDGGLILGVGGVAAPAFRGVPRGHPGYFNRAWLQQNYSAVSGACLMVRKDVFLKLGGFDGANLPQHFFDIDFCLRAQEDGLQVVWTPYANLVFAGSGVREESQSPAEAEYLKQRWHSQIVGDPCYNRNLTLVTPDFALAVPPRLNDSKTQP
ncbi:MAG: glycosyltransferase [Chthoniobacterales bacterium]